MKKICIVTGSRAEYGLLRWVMEDVKQSSKLQLQVIVTGTHLSPEFGCTYRDIEADKFHIDKKLEILVSSDTPNGVTKSMGLAMISFADALEELNPDIVLVLGDRFEIFCAVSAAMIACIPIAHLHGGEVTVGAVDESIRHSITKMSHLHFTATETYRNRVIQLGEQPNNVFHVGSLGIDSLHRLNLLSRKSLQESLGLRLGEKNLLITFHPETLNTSFPLEIQLKNLFTVLSQFKQTSLIFTKSNADAGGRFINNEIEKFCMKDKALRFLHSSLGQNKYFSLLNIVDAVVGNSSSGLLEAPSFNIGTINIGDRQRGRVRSESVIDSDFTHESLKSAFRKLNSKKFIEKIKYLKNPYDAGATSKNIVRIIAESSFDNLLKKKIYDV